MGAERHVWKPGELPEDSVPLRRWGDGRTWIQDVLAGPPDSDAGVVLGLSGAERHQRRQQRAASGGPVWVDECVGRGSVAPPTMRRSTPARHTPARRAPARGAWVQR